MEIKLLTINIHRTIDKIIFIRLCHYGIAKKNIISRIKRGYFETMFLQ